MTTSVRSMRDLLVINPDRSLVVACDSVGGIGSMPADVFAAPAVTTAHFAARVPLMEVLCAGAQPIVVINTLTHDRIAARPLIEEIKRMAAECGVPAQAVTGSTEDNVRAAATGIGVVVIGQLMSSLRSGGARAGDVVVCAGWPRSAPTDTLFPGHPDQISLAETSALASSEWVHDLLPVGSRGALWEVKQMARSAGLSAAWHPDHSVPPSASGGPSSCLLLACDSTHVATLRELVSSQLPWHVVATLTAP